MATTTNQQAFELAIQYHQDGRLAEAREIYRRILLAEPRHPGALHLLGVIAHQNGQNETAEKLIREAIEANPSVAAFHSNLGLVFIANGRSEEAIASFHRAIQLQPDSAEVHRNLGQACQDRGQPDAAIAAYRQAIRLGDNFAATYRNLGLVLKAKGLHGEAADAFRQAIVLDPNDPEARNDYGIVLKAQGQVEEAIGAYRHAIALRPAYPAALNNLGNALRADGQLDEAVACFHQAIALNASFPEAYCNLGNALVDKGATTEAMAAFRQAIALNPGFAEAHFNLGNALKDERQLDEAIASYRRAIDLRPTYVEACNNLAVTLKDKGQLDEAIAAFRRAMALHPDNPTVQSNLVYSLHFHPGSDAQSLLREHRQWNQQFAIPLRRLLRPHTNNRDPDRRLRIGYVSPDFRDHVVGRNVLPILERHDRKQVEVYCYANVLKADALTLRFRKSCDGWRDITLLPDREVTDLIRADKIDILVDLTLHMENSRLLVLAHKPAPVQVTWAGYPGTTGLDTVDYRLTDPYLDPPGCFDADYSEESFRLPDSFWCYDPLAESPTPNPLPAPDVGHVTFGSLNNYCKVHAGVIDLWSKVLCAMKDSHLLLLSPQGAHRHHALNSFERCGVSAGRVEWFTPAPRPRYLESYHRIDLGLDTYPYNGHTTSLDSFWMGVPVVTLVGKTAVGRGGLSQAMNLRLPELVAESQEDYVRKAVGLASDLPRLAALRQNLRPRMVASPLTDARRFTQNVEYAYRAMWRKWCGR